ncbi:MAG: hypothetical protein JWN60_3294 [Acidobacteria bacterium]|jgi:hypothetical protein|nr:hypothetical protein [Acidobacteriota bacterium]
MVEYVPFIWFLTAILIPVALLIIGVVNLFKKVHFVEVLGKLLVALFLYVPATIFGLTYIVGLINMIADARVTTIDGVRGDPALDFTSCAVVFGYAVYGLFLCWFVNKDLLETLSFITRSKQTTQSIFDAK